MQDIIKLLVVDDEEQFLRTMRKLLERRGFAVTVVSTGTQALEAARKEEFHVALVDLKMPGMDGEQVLAALKKEHPGLEIIVLTGHGSVDSAVRSSELDAFSYLEKPAELDTLLFALKGALAKNTRKRRSSSDSSGMR